MFTDIVGYTAMMQKEESTALSTVKHHQDILVSTVKIHHGKVIEFYGDGSLSIFNSATDAVESAIEIQEQLRQNPKVPLRIGIHIGEILIENKRIFGDGVNLASRIESLGQAGTIFISENVCEKIRNNPQFKVQSLGSFELKNVGHPMEVFAVSNEGFPVPEKHEITGKLKSSKRSRIFPSDIKINKSILYRISIVIMMAVVMYFIFVPFNRNYTSQLTEKSIVVLPFNNYSTSSDQQFFADGMADELRSQLLSIRNLKVIAQASSRYYKDKQMSLKQIGKDLNVQYVLEGNVQRSEDYIKVNVQLSNTETEELEWTSPAFNEKLEDVFLLQNKIAQEIVNQLKIKLSDHEKNILGKIPSRNAEAYLNYQKGQQIIRRGGGRLDELDEAVSLFKKAIDLDPGFSLAYVGLSYAYLEYIFWGRRPSNEFQPKALNAAFMALELDDNNAEVYGALGAINFYRFEFETAKGYLDKAIQLSPNFIPPYEYLSWIHIFENDKEKAIQLLQKAQELDPLSTKYIGDMGQAYFYFHKYDEGLKIIKSALLNHPDDNWLLWIQACLYLGKDHYEEAISTFQKRSAGKDTNWMLGYAYGMAGNKKEAERILNYQLEKRTHEHVPAIMIGTIYLGLGNKDKALEWLERDMEEGGQGMLFGGLKMDKVYDPIRNDPRFKKILDNLK